MSSRILNSLDIKKKKKSFIPFNSLQIDPIVTAGLQTTGYFFLFYVLNVLTSFDYNF